MADSYATIAMISRTGEFQERVYACAAQQGAADPTGFGWENRYAIASAPSWAARVDDYMSANPGTGNQWAADQSCISDADILAVVQPMIAPPEPTAGTAPRRKR